MRSNCASSRLASALALLVAALPTIAAEVHKRGGVTPLFDGPVTLARGATVDRATREIRIHSGATVLVVVQEDGTDVKLSLNALAPDGASIGPQIEVENNLQGEALELALLTTYGADRILVTLIAPPDTLRAGTVRLRASEFGMQAADDPHVEARIDAFRAWTRATRADLTAQTATDDALPAIDRSIAIFEGRTAGDEKLAALARLVRARILYYHELNPREARAEAQRSGNAFASPAVHDMLNAARARRLEAAALQEIAINSNATNPTAAEADVEARRLFQSLVADDSPLDRVGRARARNLLGLQDLNALAWKAARPHFEAALADYRSVGNRTGELQTLRNLGLLENSHGDYQRAAAAYDRLLAEKAAITDPDEHATLLINAATSFLNAGRVDDALVQYRQAIDFTRRKALGPPRGRALHGLGMLYWRMGDSVQAESLFAEALRVRRELLDSAGLFESLHANGALAREAGNIEVALNMHREALTRAPNAVATMRAKLDLANDFAAKADFVGAIRECREALAVKIEYARHPIRSDIKVALADFLAQRSGSDARNAVEAAQLANDALQEAIAAVDAPLEIEARRILAELRVAKHDFDGARQQLERAINLALQYRTSSTNPELQITSLKRHERAFRDYIDFEMRAAGSKSDATTLRMATAGEIRALLMLESARDANFRANGAYRPIGEKSRRLEALLTQLAEKRVRVATLAERASPPARQIELLQTEMTDIRSQIDSERLSERTTRGGATDIRELRPPPLYRQDVLQLSYAMGVTRGYLWVREGQNIRVAVLPASRAAIERAVDDLYESDRIQAPADFEKAMVKLGALLLPQDSLLRTRSIEVIADGKLASAPFAAMLAASKTPEVPEERSVTLLTSMYGLPKAVSSPQRTWRLVLMNAESAARQQHGATTALFPTLQYAGSESEAVASIVADSASRIKLIKGADLSVSTFGSTWRQGADIVHIAMHGLADLRQPLASLLAFPADERGTPTYLTAGQIQLWSGDVGLVYLSACETAQGPERFAAGMPGLQQAFLHAGAHYVIATLWAIEDKFARDFSIDFYRHLQDGASAPQALATTQREWLTAPGAWHGQQGRRRVTAAAYSIYRE